MSMFKNKTKTKNYSMADEVKEFFLKRKISMTDFKNIASGHYIFSKASVLDGTRSTAPKGAVVLSVILNLEKLTGNKITAKDVEMLFDTTVLDEFFINEDEKEEGQSEGMFNVR